MEKQCPCCKLMRSKNWKYIIILMLFIVFSIYNIYAINQVDKRIAQTIDGYQQSITDIETELKGQNKDLMTEFYKLRLDWTNEKIRLETKKSYVEGELFRIQVYGVVFLTITSIFGGTMWSGIKTRVDNAVAKVIENEVKVKKNIIENIIDEKDKERKVKLEKKILMVSRDEESNEEVKSFLDSMGFKYIFTKKIEDISVEEKYHLIFLNNKDGNIEKDKDGIKQIAEKISNKYGKDKLYFYYNNEGLHLNYKNIKLNYCNSEFTLYRNLIDTLLVADNIKLLEKAIS